jgi:HSP20 family protein
MVAFRFRVGDPWRELRHLQREMNEILESAFGPSEPARPACNVWEGDEDMLVTCEVPGVGTGDLNISVMGDLLTVSGECKPAEQVEETAYHRHERPTGTFSRDVQLPARSDTEHVDAEFNEGVLTIRLPKAAEEKPRKIEVKSV